MRDEVKPLVNAYSAKAEFPIQLIDKFRASALAGPAYEGCGAHPPAVSNLLTRPRSAWRRDR